MDESFYVSSSMEKKKTGIESKDEEKPKKKTKSKLFHIGNGVLLVLTVPQIIIPAIRHYADRKGYVNSSYYTVNEVKPSGNDRCSVDIQEVNNLVKSANDARAEANSIVFDDLFRRDTKKDDKFLAKNSEALNQADLLKKKVEQLNRDCEYRGVSKELKTKAIREY